MSYIDKIQVGEVTYDLQSDGVAQPGVSTNQVNAIQVIESVQISKLLDILVPITFKGGDRRLDGDVYVGWSQDQETGLYVNAVDVNTLDGSSEPVMVGLSYPAGCSDATRKLIQKAAGLLCDMITQNKTVQDPYTIKAYATKKPATDLTIAFRGMETPSTNE